MRCSSGARVAVGLYSHGAWSNALDLDLQG